MADPCEKCDKAGITYADPQYGEGRQVQIRAEAARLNARRVYVPSRALRAMKGRAR